MKKILTLVFSMTTCFLFAQHSANFWRQVTAQEVFLPERASTATFPPSYLIYSLDMGAIRNFLREAPMEGTAAAKSGEFKFQLPMPDGTFETFGVWESPIMHPDLAAKYPMIKSYAGRGVDNPAKTVRFGYGPAGFYAVAPSGNGGSIIEQYATFQDKYYLCYAHSGFLAENLNVPLVKFITDKETEEETLDFVNDENNDHLRGGGDGALTQRRDYLFVLACTGEYGQMHGDDVPTVLGTLVQALAAMNGLLERDIDVRFTMHPDNDKVVYLNAATDPFSNSNMGGALLGQNEDHLNQVIGFANFDVGHLYTGPCSDVGGVVSGTVCALGKARGVTCNFNDNVIATTLSIAAHEIMHQFSGGHTFNFCPGQDGQYSSSSSCEPGSGSTILSYQGACGSGNNVPGPATLQYHAVNIEEVWNYTHFQGGATCTSPLTTSNHSPVVSENYNDGFYIPISTPFELQVSATDADGDPLTYSWEQMNRAPAAPVGQPFGDAPSFRVFDHNSSPVRYFPRLPLILNNASDNFEVLPTYSKNMDFRCVVRDNNVTEGAGGMTWVDVKFKATNTAGPFLVTYPNTSTVVWTAGEQVEVTWDVANTNTGLVNCKSVNILLSTNGGNTFNHLVVAATPNDGKEIITVPALIGTNIRLKIKASDNIFFDLSNANFEIKPPTAPFYDLLVAPEIQRVCAPTTALVEVDMRPYAGYNQPVQLDILDGLPAGTVVNFTENPVAPGNSTILELDMENVVDIGLFEATMRAISGQDTTYRKIFFEMVYNDFSSMVLEGPVNGGSGFDLTPTFNWTNLPHADLYDFQLATSPAFTPSSIVKEALNLTSTSYSLNFALQENTVYYWRIRASNQCGKGDFSLKNTFQTFTTTCTSKAASDVPIPISAIGLPVIESKIAVLENGTISDVNIRDLKGSHDAVPDLRVSVISPIGTSVKLFEGICGNVTTFNLGLNDESPFAIACPPNTGLTYKPQEPLSKFIGENSLGTWTLKLEVINTIGNGGALNGWKIEFCANVTPEHPFLLKNDTLFLPPNATRLVTSALLAASDPDDPISALDLTIVDPTKYGQISKNGVALNPGDKFKFTDVDAGAITYTNTNPDESYDFFTFTVVDGRGGFMGTPRFNIVIDENQSTPTDETGRGNRMTLYPNPANELLNIGFDWPIATETTLLVSDMQGRLLGQQPVSTGAGLLQMDLQGLPSGVYFLTLKSAESLMTEKFVVQR